MYLQSTDDFQCTYSVHVLSIVIGKTEHVFAFRKRGVNRTLISDFLTTANVASCCQVWGAMSKWYPADTTHDPGNHHLFSVLPLCHVVDFFLVEFFMQLETIHASIIKTIALSFSDPSWSETIKILNLHFHVRASFSVLPLSKKPGAPL